LLAACSRVPKSTPELLHDIGYQSRTGNFKKSLSRLLSRRLLEMTNPEKPRARSQRYRITAKGLEFIKKEKTQLVKIEAGRNNPELPGKKRV
jgi:ATP-dependent DNA helicase RecG